MSTIEATSFPIARLVDELFSTHRDGQNCQNPVTGGGYVHGLDPIKPQKEKARRGLLAANGSLFMGQLMRNHSLFGVMTKGLGYWVILSSYTLARWKIETTTSMSIRLSPTTLAVSCGKQNVLTVSLVRFPVTLPSFRN